jgi:hypothetical protein
MAMASIPGCGIVQWPNHTWSSVYTLSGGSTLATTGHYESIILRASEDMAITHIGHLCHTATGSPKAIVSISQVSSSTGFPSGTLYGATNNAKGTTATLAGTTWDLTALAETATVNKGDWYAVMIEKEATGTSFRPGYMAGARWGNATNYATQPRVINTTGSAAYANQVGDYCIALGSSSTTFYAVPGLVPFTGASASNMTTSGHKRNIKFSLPFKCRVSGLVAYSSSSTTTADFDAEMIAADGTTILATSTWDESYRRTGFTGIHILPFTSPVILDANTTYYAGIKATTANTTGIIVNILPSTNYYGAAPGGGNGWFSYYNGSSWTDVTNQIPGIELMIDQLDDGASGGGGASFSAFVG